jgi:CPA1 family monovalent cation:H+ antiporter
VTGVVLGGTGQRLTNARIRLQLHAVYGTVVFLLESVVFSLIGLELPGLIRDLSNADGMWPLQALAVAATLMTVRMLWVFPLSAALQRKNGGPESSWRVAAVTSWAGTRGVVPLAAALSIPLAADDGTLLPQRELVLVLATSVVVVTLIVQGFTLAPLVRRSGIALEPAHTRREEAEAVAGIADAGLRHLEQIADLEAVPEVVVDRLRRQLRTRQDHARERLDGDYSYWELRRDLIAVENAELQRLYDSHRISDTTRRRIQRSLDLEEAGLGE